MLTNQMFMPQQHGGEMGRCRRSHSREKTACARNQRPWYGESGGGEGASFFSCSSSQTSTSPEVATINSSLLPFLSYYFSGRLRCRSIPDRLIIWCIFKTVHSKYLFNILGGIKEKTIFLFLY